MLEGAGSAPPGLRLVRDEPERIILAHEPPFRIGEAEFRPETREVLFRGEVSIVEPRVMQVLVALHRAGGGVVSKDDLATLCWEGRIVGEDAINRVVSRLRSVAGKQAGGQFRVETITKVGYRLVDGKGAPTAAQAQSVEALTEPSAGSRRRDILVGSTALGAAALAGGAWFEFERDKLPPQARLLIDDARKGLFEGTVEQTGNAIGQLRQATQLAPGSAEAWGLLGFAYMSYADDAASDQRANLRARGRAAIQRALSLEPHQADALTAELWAMPVYRNWFAYDATCRAALRYHPKNTALNYALAGLFLQTGRTREAADQYNSVALIHAPRIRVCRAVALWDAGRLDEAEDAINQSMELWPRHYGIWFTKLYFLMYGGRPAESVAMLTDVNSRPLGIPDWNYDLVTIQAKALANGDRAQIRDAIETWRDAATKGTGFTENGAIFAAFVGDYDEAFRLLDALYFNRGFAMSDTYFAKEQGMYSAQERHTYNLFRRQLSGLRRDPRFNRLTRELGLDDYWARSNSRALVVA
jgi:DNA-binding winged helix-turn-helix (wHTH) protein/Flp pilus assembly protein TadD